MPRPVHALHQLTARKVASLKDSGRYSDGGNLYLRITPTGSRSWSFLYRWHGKLTELGFGSAATVTLAEARERAAAARKLLGAGSNPKAAKGAAHDATFRACAEKLIESMRPSWRSAVHLRQWQRSLFEDAKALADLPVDAIGTQDVLAVLQKHWQAKPETAARLRARIEHVLDYAKATVCGPKTWPTRHAGAATSRTSCRSARGATAAITPPWPSPTFPRS